MKATISLKFLACLKCNLNGRFLSKTKCALEQIKFLLLFLTMHQFFTNIWVEDVLVIDLDKSKHKLKAFFVTL